MHGDDRASVERALENWNAGWRTKDAQLAAKDYSDDADWTNAFGMVAHGRTAIEEVLRGVFALPHVMAARGAVVEQEIRFVGADVALARTRVRREGQQTPSGEELGGRDTSHLRVFVRSEGGWCIVSHLISDARSRESSRH